MSLVDNVILPVMRTGTKSRVWDSSKSTRGTILQRTNCRIHINLDISVLYRSLLESWIPIWGRRALSRSIRAIPFFPFFFDFLPCAVKSLSLEEVNGFVSCRRGTRRRTGRGQGRRRSASPALRIVVQVQILNLRHVQRMQRTSSFVEINLKPHTT